MAKIVQFARGNKNLYNILTAEEKQRKIFFAQDTNEIIVNNVVYGINLKSEDLELLSSVEVNSPGKLTFTLSNGKKKIIQTAPLATIDTDGLLSKEDKALLNSIPSTYATKQEVKDVTSRVYRFRGTLQSYNDLPDNAEIGDTYNIVKAFSIDGTYYSAGTNVAWDGENWDPLGGETDSYSKEDADAKFVSWTTDSNNKKLIILPQGSKIIGTRSDGDGSNLIQLGIYENGAIQQIEVGSVKEHLCLNSLDRPTLDLPNGVKERIAYLSDTGDLDLSNYPDNAVVVYIPELKQEFVDSYGVPNKVDNSDASYVLGNDYIAIIYTESQTTKYDLYTASSVVPDTTYAIAKSLREEYMNMFTWEESAEEFISPSTSLINHIANGGTVTLTNNLVLSEPLQVNGNTVLNLNGRTIKYEGTVFQVNEGAVLTINGDGIINGADGEDAPTVKAAGNVIINSGTFTCGVDANDSTNSVIYSTGGQVTINGGYFAARKPYTNGWYYVLNIQNNVRDNTKFIVYGGDFENYNPASGDDNLGGNFVADGYESLKISNDPTVYRVVKQ